MALYPCDATGHRYVGPQRTIYPAVASGAITERRKLRLCKDHFEAFLEQLALHAVDQEHTSANGAPIPCYLCDRVPEYASSALYVTAYDYKAERQDWWAPIHDNCVAGTMADWHLEPHVA